MGIVVQVVSNVAGRTETLGGPRIFDQDKISLGRAASNDLVLSAPDVSGKHLELTVSKDNGNPSIVVVDLGSSNGTFVEEKRIEPKVPVPLAANQRADEGLAQLVALVWARLEQALALM